MQRHLGNVWRAAIYGGVSAVGVYATGVEFADRTLHVAFAAPFLLYLAAAYQVKLGSTMASR